MTSYIFGRGKTHYIMLGVLPPPELIYTPPYVTYVHISYMYIRYVSVGYVTLQYTVWTILRARRHLVEEIGFVYFNLLWKPSSVASIKS